MSGGGSSIGSGGRGNGGGSCRGCGGCGLESCSIMSARLLQDKECHVHVSAAADRVVWRASQRAAARNRSTAPSTLSRNHRSGTQCSCSLPLLAHGMRRRACGSVDIPTAGAHTVAKDPRPPRRRSCVRVEQAQCPIRTQECSGSRSAITQRPLRTRGGQRNTRRARNLSEKRILSSWGTGPMEAYTGPDDPVSIFC
jgi:hypothetical protein